jgi:hypothetical protein
VILYIASVVEWNEKRLGGEGWKDMDQFQKIMNSEMTR